MRGTVTVPPQNAKRWQGIADQQQQLAQQQQMLANTLDGEVRAWAIGQGITIGPSGQPPHYYLAEKCTQLREGKPPEPQVIDMKDLQRLVTQRAKRAAR